MVNAAGSSLAYAGYIGGSGSEQARGIAVDGWGDAYVAGSTSSAQATFPNGDGFGSVEGPDNTFNGPTGGFDAFVARVRHEPAERPVCREDGLDALLGTPIQGVASGTVHSVIEPAARGASPPLGGIVRTLNCTVVVPIEDTADDSLDQ